MNRRNILSLSFITALGLALVPSGALSQQKTLKEQIIGTWMAVSWMQVNMDGSTFQRFGSYPKGVSVFDTNDRFIVMYARPDLLKIDSSNPMKATPDENRSIVEGSIAYFGTSHVDETAKTITLLIESSTFPNEIGREQKRTITSLTASELKMSNPGTLSGSTLNYAMRRAPTFASK